MSIYVIGNNSNNAHGLEFPQIELRYLGGALQYRIVGKGVSPKLAKLNPRLVLFRRVHQSKDTQGQRKNFREKVQYVITRIMGWGNNCVVFADAGQPGTEGWITLAFERTGVRVNPHGILNLFSENAGGPIGTFYRRRSRKKILVGNNASVPASSNFFAQYYGIGFACDNPDNSDAMNRRGQNLLYQHISPFKAGVARNILNEHHYFFRIKTS